MLFGRRGVNRTNHHLSSSAFERPSIHPKHNAISTASAADTDGIPDAFLASFKYIPGAVVCSRSRKLSKSLPELKERIGRSDDGALVDILKRLMGEA